MSSLWNSLFGRDEPREPSPPEPGAAARPAPSVTPQPSQPGEQQPNPAPTAAETPAELQEALTTLIRRVNQAGGRMPEGGVPGVREVEDVLRPLLSYLRTNDATEAEMIGVRTMINDYLPTTVDAFLRLPASFAETHRNRAGRTPADELLLQLDLLAEGAEEYATAIYAGDAQRLTNQGRFLETKFARSELDL